MRLKLKFISLKTGKPIAFLHEKDAGKLKFHIGERIEIRKNGFKVTAIIDLLSSFIKPGEVVLSEDILKKLKIKKGYVDISLAETSESSQLLHEKMDCREYNYEDLDKIIKDIVNNNLSEAEIAYFVSGVFHCGMTDKETLFLTKAIFNNGKKLTWKNKKIADKHCIGGIPGNRTTPIVVSICAAAGVTIPKTSSRAITSASGTADTMESITKVDLSVSELMRIVNKTNGCLAWGGSLGLAPADDKLIKIEKILRLDPEPQLLASILAKKLSAGSNYILIDIPYGKGAKVSLSEAKKLSRKFKSLGKKLKLKVETMLTNGEQPIGNGIGPVLEMKDVLRVLRLDNPPIDLKNKSLKLAGKILEMVGKAKSGKGIKKAKEILQSGKAFEKFVEIIEAQGGEIKDLGESKLKYNFKSQKKGIIKELKNKEINYLARLSGCPLDKKSGIYLHKKQGNLVKKGEVILTLYSESKSKLKEAIKYLKDSKPIIVE